MKAHKRKVVLLSRVGPQDCPKTAAGLGGLQELGREVELMVLTHIVSILNPVSLELSTSQTFLLIMT